MWHLNSLYSRHLAFTSYDFKPVAIERAKGFCPSQSVLPSVNVISCTAMTLHHSTEDRQLFVINSHILATSKQFCVRRVTVNIRMNIIYGTVHWLQFSCK
jgi:hypothetical protein